MSANSCRPVKQITIRVLLNKASSGDLLFIKKGSHPKSTYLPRRGLPHSRVVLQTAPFKQKVGVIDTSYSEYSASKLVKPTPDIVEYEVGAQAPLYHLIIDKQTLHDIGVNLDFREKTTTIDSIL